MKGKSLDVLRTVLVFSVFGCFSSINAENMMPNPGAEKIIPSNEYPGTLLDPRAEMAEYVPAEGWGCYNSSGYSLWGATDKEAHTGKYSAFLTVVKSNENGVTHLELCLGKTNGSIAEYALAAKPNTVYYFSFWLKGNPSLINVNWLGWKTESPESREWQYTSIKRGINPTSEWKKYEGSFMTTMETKKFVVRLQIPHTISPQPGDTIYVDDVEIMPFDEKNKELTKEQK